MLMTQRAHACLCSCTGRLLVPKPLNLVSILHRQIVFERPRTLLHVISLGQNAGFNFLSSTKPCPNLKSGTTLLLREKIRTLKLTISAVAEDSTNRIGSSILSEGGLSQGTEDLLNWREKKVSMAEVEAEEEAKLQHRKKGRVVIIAGPTAVGKTRLALALAKRLGGEIISADSVQVALDTSKQVYMSRGMMIFCSLQHPDSPLNLNFFTSGRRTYRTSFSTNIGSSCVFAFSCIILSKARFLRRGLAFAVNGARYALFQV